MSYSAPEKLLVLGDSHTQVFRSGKFPINFPEYDWDVVSVVGATISGIDNPNSKTNAINIFMERLAIRDYSKVILQLGEVDIGFVMWFKSERDALPVEHYFSLTVQKYCEFILLVKMYCEDILVVSIPQPTIKDGETPGKVANQRSSIKATQIERAEQTIKFNETLAKFCKGQDIKFLDLDPYSIGADGLITDELLNPKKTDHHYCKFAYSKLLVEQLKKAQKNGW